MNQVEIIMEQYEIGYKIFEKIFQLSDKEIKEKLKSILKGNTKHDYSYILADGEVTRIIKNEKYKSIEISFYGSIEISSFGIYYHPEHGCQDKLVDFNEHFVL